jgi:hypothetical protein
VFDLFEYPDACIGVRRRRLTKIIFSLRLIFMLNALPVSAQTYGFVGKWDIVIAGVARYMKNGQ